MEWLNYHHLHYFWTVARLGSVTAAAAELRVAQPTVSGQLRELERNVGTPLFTRSGRGLALTETGRVVQRYAEEIFSLGRELQDTLQGQERARLTRFTVGIASSMPKVLTHRLLTPALALPGPLQLTLRQDRADRLLVELAAHALDFVISDAPAPPGLAVRAFSHLLGECGVLFCAARALARNHQRRFPDSLDGAPMLMPSAGTALRRSLDAWFDGVGVRPRVVLECDDSALLKAFGRAGAGIVAAPLAARDEVASVFNLEPVGEVPELRERFYAISLERRVKHPAVRAISLAARTTLAQVSHRKSR